MEPIENKYYEWIGSKTYFDCLSSEFKSKTIEYKLLNLALYLKDGGDLHYAINSYKLNRAEYILRSLIPTLLYYIEYIRTGKKLSVLYVLLKKYLSEYQLISLLAAELSARLNFEFESNEDYSVMKKIYKMDIGGYVIEEYLDSEKMTKKENLISIFKGNLQDDFDLGDFNENLPIKDKERK
ncbi:MAG: hypothetical protein Q8P34_09945 [Bacteroidota bacterium]|nr:hypothetical protein [Bacteroidota bacterium]